MSTTNSTASARRMRSKRPGSTKSGFSGGVSMSWIWISSNCIMPGIASHVVKGPSETSGSALVSDRRRADLPTLVAPTRRPVRPLPGNVKARCMPPSALLRLRLHLELGQLAAQVGAQVVGPLCAWGSSPSSPRGARSSPRSIRPGGSVSLSQSSLAAGWSASHGSWRPL